MSETAAIKFVPPVRRAFLEALSYADQQSAITRCAHCQWSFRGLVADGKRAFETHMELRHGRHVRRHR